MLSKTIDGKGLGWRRDLPDYRDYTRETPEIQKTLKKGGARRAAAPPAVGYDDAMKIKNACGQETTGALLIRNSWGEGGVMVVMAGFRTSTS